MGFEKLRKITNANIHNLGKEETLLPSGEMISEIELRFLLWLA
jgi:hypothetical protein